MAPSAEAGGDEFEGDEFANNLFSDLAPLLTLFGEQVTKQFLSMSMGWADNVLLAMGPLGILTIVVSAIRVGGVRQLKALVGRARESQSTAEQELLSSTSDDVCELWNGKEIVRMIGSPAGMKNLFITRDKSGRTGIIDLREAIIRGLMKTTAFPSYTARRYPDSIRIFQDPRYNMVVGHLTGAAPNLALNVKNATAPTEELWLWAALGIVLQLTAMAVPGVATYYWKWEKGGLPVASYGYPCFLIGTSLVVIGVAACGHVIEDVTEETDFQPNEDTGDPDGSPKVIRIVRLQRSCTVGDQHFPAFALYNTPGDLKLRTSRLDRQGHSSLAATATATAVVGFVVQFIGLRALHWSATITQLGVTLIMTGVRAYVRRGLAANPTYDTLPEGHEAPVFTLKLLQDNLDEETAEDYEAIEHKWEIPTLCSYDSPLRFDGFEMGIQEELKMEWGLEGSLGSKATDKTSKATNEPSDVPENVPASGVVELHGIVQKLLPQHDRALEVADVLAKAIEGLAATFAHATNIQWAEDTNPYRDATYLWSVPATERIHPKYEKATKIRFVVEQGPSPDTFEPGLRPWVLQRRGDLYNILALWLSTLNQRKGGVLSLEQYWLRVVGRGDPTDSMLQDWLGQEVYRSRKVIGTATRRSELGLLKFNVDDITDRPDELDLRPGPVFGSFLSYTALPIDSEYEGHNLYIITPSRSDIAVQCAQEILSLFILQVASWVETLRGGRETPKQETPSGRDGQEEITPRKWENPVLRELGEVVVHSGLARDISEAYTLIIPAFHHYGLLPGPPE